MSRRFLPRSVVVLGGARTPIGSFLGSLSSLSAPRLAAVAMAGALQRSGVAPAEIEHCVVGQVLTAGQGQAPQRQAMLAAGAPSSMRTRAIVLLYGAAGDRFYSASGRIIRLSNS